MKPYSKGNLKKGLALERPIFISLSAELKRLLGEPQSEATDPLYEKLIWPDYELTWNKHSSNSTFQGLIPPKPDFVLLQNNAEILAVEAKNWAYKTRFSSYVFQRDVIDYFKSLPTKCRKVLVISWLRGWTDKDDEFIADEIARHNIDVQQLNYTVGSPYIKASLIYLHMTRLSRLWCTKVTDKRGIRIKRQTRRPKKSGQSRRH